MKRRTSNQAKALDYTEILKRDAHHYMAIQMHHHSLTMVRGSKGGTVIDMVQVTQPPIWDQISPLQDKDMSHAIPGVTAQDFKDEIDLKTAYSDS